MIKQAIILAAGVGSRLRPITNEKPKCLVEVNGVPLLEHMVNNLLENGIDKITIVCGYKGELIKEYCHKIFPDRNFNFINNKDYSTSNNLYSLYLASEAFKEGSFLMNADIIFDSSVLALMQKTDDSCVAVDTSQYIEESMKVTVTEESISSISKKITESDAYGCSIDLYKFTKSDAKIILNKTNEILDGGGINEWTEVALDTLFTSGQLETVPLDINKGRWFEIDTIEDLVEAEILFNKHLSKIKDKKVFFADNDGTLSVGGTLFETAKSFLSDFPVDKLLYILTNNSSKTDDDIISFLEKQDVKTDKLRTLISTLPATLFLKKNKISKLFWVANESVGNWLLEQGFIFDDKNPEAVLLCYDNSISYDKIVKLTEFVRNDVAYYATHTDLVCPVEGGYLPDIGSFIQMIANATGKRPIKEFGKPNPDFVLPVLEDLGLMPDDAVVIGDRLYTDIELGKRANITTVLVLSGEMTRAKYEFESTKADIVVPDVGRLSAFVD